MDQIGLTDRMKSAKKYSWLRIPVLCEGFFLGKIGEYLSLFTETPQNTVPLPLTFTLSCLRSGVDSANSLGGGWELGLFSKTTTRVDNSFSSRLLLDQGELARLEETGWNPQPT